jgi:checkpoint serine/threonine-protein kinase
MESLFSPQAPQLSGGITQTHTHSDDPHFHLEGEATTTAPTTDFALIESQKENIRPLPTGRSAATLSTLFEKDAESERVIHEGHERWKEQIAEAERRERDGEDMVEGVQDVLDVYNR